MNEQHQFRSFFIAGVVSVIIFASVVYLIVEQLQVESVPSEESWNPIAEQGQELTEDAIATIGQNFIKTLSSYQMDQEQPIQLQGVENVGGNWIARYKVMQQEEGETLVYFYTLDIQDGHVVKQHAALSDRSGTILVSSPEPHTIIERGLLTVKGQVFDGQNQVVVKLLGQGEGVLLERRVSVEPAEGTPYSLMIDLADYQPGEYQLLVSDGNAEVRSPFILSAK